MKESDEAIDDVRDASGIEDGTGAMGDGEGLGSDLGTDHASTGAEAPKDDTSDAQVIAKADGEELKNDQLNSGDNAQGDVKDAGQVDPANARPEGDCQAAVDGEFGKTAAMDDSKVEKIEDLKEADSFEEAYNALLQELEEEGLGADAADPAGVADAPVPAAVADSQTPELPEEVPANDGVPADEVEADYDAVDALDVDDDDEDDSIMDTLVGEEANVEDAAETRDTSAVEDKKEDNLGDNLGPDSDNESKGGDAPKDDTSDNKVVDKETELKDEKLATSGDAQGDVKDAGQVDPADARVEGDTPEAADDSFGKQKPLEEECAEKKEEEKKDEKDDKAVDEACAKSGCAAGGSGCEDGKCEEKKEEPVKEADEDDVLEAAVLGVELKEAADELDDVEAEEDALMADAKQDTAKSEFSTAELNEDEDDDIMNAVMGGE